MTDYSIAQFIQETAQKEEKNNFFELESPQTLEINLNGSVWTKLGSMVAYTGNIQFHRQGLSEQGFSTLFKKALSGEGMTLMKAEGNGRIYVADRGKKIRILHLNNETICINGNDVLAIEPSLRYEITMMKSIAGMVGGGLFNVKISGSGRVAMTTHGNPITLLVIPQNPVYTDPNATVAWAGELNPEIKTQISWKNLIGRGSGESIQLLFQGNGWVLVQPYEEIYQAGNG